MAKSIFYGAHTSVSCTTTSRWRGDISGFYLHYVLKIKDQITGDAVVTRWVASASRQALPAMTAKEAHRLKPESSYFLKKQKNHKEKIFWQPTQILENKPPVYKVVVKLILPAYML